MSQPRAAVASRASLGPWGRLRSSRPLQGERGRESGSRSKAARRAGPALSEARRSRCSGCPSGSVWRREEGAVVSYWRGLGGKHQPCDPGSSAPHTGAPTQTAQPRRTSGSSGSLEGRQACPWGAQHLPAALWGETSSGGAPGSPELPPPHSLAITWCGRTGTISLRLSRGWRGTPGPGAPGSWSTGHSAWPRCPLLPRGPRQPVLMPENASQA